MWADVPPSCATDRNSEAEAVTPPSVPRAFPNIGLWCWVNSLLQTLDSITDPRWRSVLDAAVLPSVGDGTDLLSALAAAVQWVSCAKESTADGRPWPLMKSLERALVYECGLSPSAEQDVHEALLQVLEAIHAGLLRRELAAARLLPLSARAASWWSPCCYWPRGAAWAKIEADQKLIIKSKICTAPSHMLAPAAEAAAARRGLLELWEGQLEETRVCVQCGMSRIDRDGTSQAFRCLSLPMPMPSGLGHPLPPVNIVAALRASYGGGSCETLEGVLCAGCSVTASLCHFRAHAVAGSLPALIAWRRLSAAGGHFKEAEGIGDFCCIPGSPVPLLRRSTQLRKFRVATPPKILALHLRRLGFGPCGPVKSDAIARYPLQLPVAVAAAHGAPSPGSQGGRETTSTAAAGKEHVGESSAATETELCCYTLRSVVSHLGTASGGHFLAHRRWTETEGAAVGSEIGVLKLGVGGASSSSSNTDFVGLAPLGGRWLLCPGAASMCVPHLPCRAAHTNNLPIPLGAGGGNGNVASGFTDGVGYVPNWMASLYGRRFGGPTWVRADDDRVTAASSSDVLRFPCAYILLYERSPNPVGSDSAGGTNISSSPVFA